MSLVKQFSDLYDGKGTSHTTQAAPLLSVPLATERIVAAPPPVDVGTPDPAPACAFAPSLAAHTMMQPGAGLAPHAEAASIPRIAPDPAFGSSVAPRTSAGAEAPRGTRWTRVLVVAALFALLLVVTVHLSRAPRRPPAAAAQDEMQYDDFLTSLDDAGADEEEEEGDAEPAAAVTDPLFQPL